jgi:hypothetical protein
LTRSAPTTILESGRVAIIFATSKVVIVNVGALVFGPHRSGVLGVGASREQAKQVKLELKLKHDAL